MFSYHNPRYRECRDLVATIVVCLLIMMVAIFAASSVRYIEAPLYASLSLVVLTLGRIGVERRLWERSTEGRKYAAVMRGQVWPKQRRVEFRRVTDRIVLWMSAERDEARTEDDPLWRRD